MAGSGVANSETFGVATPSDRQIVLTRVFDAPREVVFEAMSKPEHVRRWWGILGEGYSVPVCEVDLRPGGAWRYVNRTPHGDVAFYGVYKEVSPPERVVFTEIFEMYPDTESLVEVVLEDDRGRTRFTLTATYPTVEVRDQVIASGMSGGAAISYDRLEEVAREIAESREAR